MAHFAKIEDGIVTQVVVVADEHEANGQAFLNSIGLDGQWVQTSYNHNLRRKFAGIGDTYDAEADVFKPAKPVVEGLEYAWDEAGWQWLAVEPAQAALEK